MKNIFTEHPHSIGESYFQHFFFALGFGGKMIVGGLACVIHAIFPFLCKKTASDMLIEMTHDFVKRMPEPDERVLAIHNCIEQKRTTDASNH